AIGQLADVHVRDVKKLVEPRRLYVVLRIPFREIVELGARAYRTGDGQERKNDKIRNRSHIRLTKCAKSNERHRTFGNCLPTTAYRLLPNPPSKPYRPLLVQG